MSRLDERYRLGPRIGDGGMAEVFEATLVGAAGFTRPVAVKRMLPSLSADPRFGGLFVEEARIAALLHHPNIAAVIDFDRDEEGRYFLVMELIRGLDLRRLTRSGRLPLGVALHIGGEILRGLAHAHELDDGGGTRTILRDVSPHNVMLSWGGAIKLVDFGIAKAISATDVSRTTGLRGKVAYMSPEQAQGQPLDHRSDQFAAGLILHELVTGRRVFEGATDPEILALLLTRPIPHPRAVDPGVPADIDAVVMRMVERDRDARYASTPAALDALLGVDGISARGGLELAAVLADRFASEAPRRRGALVPPGPAPGERAPEPERAPGGGGPALPGSTLSLPSPVAPPTAPEPPRRPAPRLAGAAIVVLIGFATVMLARRGGTESETEPVPETEPEPEPETESETEPEPEPEPEPGTGTGTGTETETEPGTGTGTETETEPGTEPRKPVRPTPARAPRSSRGRGTLTIRVDPWAEVLIDGRPRGNAPVTLTLARGRHTVLLRNRELDREERIDVTIAADRGETIDRRWR